MDSYFRIEDAIAKTLRSVLYNSALAEKFSHRPVILKAHHNANQDGCKNIVVFTKSMERDMLKNIYWVVGFFDKTTVSLQNLKTFKEFLGTFPGEEVKGTFITSNSSFSREAFDYAFKNSIGLARISPTFKNTSSLSVNNAVYSTSPLELKTALCDSEFGYRRKRFYGFTTEGKIEHLGSLENYIRIELSP